MEARNRKIEEWFQWIADGAVVLPRFQRYEAWGRGQVWEVPNAQSWRRQTPSPSHICKKPRTSPFSLAAPRVLSRFVPPLHAAFPHIIARSLQGHCNEKRRWPTSEVSKWLVKYKRKTGHRIFKK